MTPNELALLPTRRRPLTDCEVQALTLVLTGHHDGQIAAALGISYSRAKQIVRRALLRVDAQGRHGLIVLLWKRLVEASALAEVRQEPDALDENEYFDDWPEDKAC